jgi:hypothetical protein
MVMPCLGRTGLTATSALPPQENHHHQALLWPKALGLWSAKAIQGLPAGKLHRELHSSYPRRHARWTRRQDSSTRWRRTILFTQSCRNGQLTLTSSWHFTPLLCSTVVPKALYRQKNDFCNLRRQNALFDEFVTESSHYSSACSYQPRRLTRSLLALILRSSPNLEAH